MNTLPTMNDTKINNGEFDFHRLLCNVYDTYKEQIEASETKLKLFVDTQISSPLFGDSVRINQVLLILIGKAIETSSGGIVTVHSELKSVSNTNLQIEIVIKGSEIAASEENTSPSIQSAQSILRLIGEDFHTENRNHSGIFYSFKLNLLSFNEEEIPEVIETEFSNIDGSILIVDDNQMNLLYATTILSEWGIKCHCVDSGEAAIQAVKKASYDVILMDLQMPEMSGFEASQFLIDHLNISSPIVALTSNVSNNIEALCKRYGMQHYIMKPFEPKVMHQLLLHLMSNIRILNSQNDNIRPIMG